MISRKFIFRTLSCLLLAAVLASLALPSDTLAFGCPANAKHDCTERALQDLNNCFQFYDSIGQSWAGPIFCADTFDTSYQSCMIEKGCLPVPPAKV